MYFNKDLYNIEEHPSKKIFDTVNSKKEVINLTVGMADMKPPTTLLQELTHIQSFSHRDDLYTYADSKGLFNLRLEISKQYKTKYNFYIDPNEILITNGGAEAIWLSIFTLTNIGDSVLLPNPGYMLYAPIVRSLKRKPIFLETSIKDNYTISENHINASKENNTKLLILNSPENPTGKVYSKKQLIEIDSVCSKLNIRVIHDEVFDDITFQSKHFPIYTISPNKYNTILVNSFSKRFNLTGWRVGWLIADTKIINQAMKAHTYMNLAVNSLAQFILSRVMNDYNLQLEVQDNIYNIQKRVTFFSEEVNKVLKNPYPHTIEGAFYVFPNIENFYENKIQNKITNEDKGLRISKLLLEKYSIATVPGSGFGPNGKNHIRMCAAKDETHLKKAIEILKNI